LVAIVLPVRVPDVLLEQPGSKRIRIKIGLICRPTRLKPNREYLQIRQVARIACMSYVSRQISTAALRHHHAETSACVILYAIMKMMIWLTNTAICGLVLRSGTAHAACGPDAAPTPAGRRVPSGLSLS
jgi:hypothetical protein